MNIAITVTQKQLSELLLNMAVARLVFIWGPPGIGKSALVQQFAIMDGEEKWPYKPEDKDILYFLSQSFRSQLIKQLPNEKDVLNEKQKKLAHRAKALIKELASISLEMAQMVVSGQSGEDGLPGWFMVDIVRDLPRLIERKDN